MLSRYLLLWLICGSGLAALWPWREVDPFVGSKPVLGYLIAGTMFCVGSLLRWQEIRELGSRWGLVGWGTFTQYLAMPLLAWLMATLFGFDGDLRIGIIMAGCVPGAMASNVLTLTARGHVSYSVSLTTLATLVSPLVVPAVLKLTLGASVSQQELAKSAITLVWQVVFPVIAGFGMAHSLPGWKRLAERWAEPLAQLAILWVIAVVVALNRTHLTTQAWQLLPPLLGLNLLGFAAGWGAGRLARMPEAMQRALMLEIGMQNAGLGASLAVSLFPSQPGVALPCGLYAFGCMLTGTMLAQWLSRRPLSV
jgi:BASS family bile acid:Na+ symporter